MRPLSSRHCAAHGYRTLALAYFNEPGLPQGLDTIPLEYFARAVDVDSSSRESITITSG